MRIVQVGLDVRCGRVLPHHRHGFEEDPYLLIVHRGGRTLDCIGDGPGGGSELADWNRDPLCKAILLLRGIAFAGIGQAASEALERDTNGRVHVLSYAVDPADDMLEVSQLVRERMARFFERVERYGVVDWGIVDPETSESIIAAYLLEVISKPLAA